MGTYLSTPVTEKCEESGESLQCPDVPCSWGVVDMQGWRKSMEDAHVAVTDIPLPKSDGELPSTTADAKVFGVFDGHGGPEVARFCGLYIVSVLTQQETWKRGGLEAQPKEGEDAGESNVGKALRSAFHALDRMIDHQSKREEILGLRLKPFPGEQRVALDIPEETGASETTSIMETPAAGNGEASLVDNVAEENTEEGEDKAENDKSATDDCEGEASEASQPQEQEAESDISEAREVEADENDDDSNEAVGKEEAAEKDRDMMEPEEGGESTQDTVMLEADPSEPTKVASMFQRILAITGQGGQTGQVAVKITGDEGSEVLSDGRNDPAVQPQPAAPATGPSASRPTVMHNGRMMCNLPDHAIHAGATAIVSVITGRTLTVANAGDSRAVLCRAGGVTMPLSYDHKPQQEREMMRITKAGGFVNHFGRVNGNLNLSRSIGDLKYKQVPGIPPAEQMITAEPDIIQIALEPDDEFIILGCDGIWDCLSNEEAVRYVRDRIDSKTAAEIGKAMLDDIISEDPRVTQGIGGDNMTIMVIDLQPSKRERRVCPEKTSIPGE